MNGSRPMAWSVALVLAVAAFPSPALADSGIPMLALAWPAAWVTLAPVVLIEMLVARRVLALSWGRCAWLSLRANAWSTVVGIPLAWLLMLGAEIVGAILVTLLGLFGRPPLWSLAPLAPLFSAWVPPFEMAPHWTILGAALMLCVPFYAVSVRLEARTAERFVDSAAALRWARAANRTTYALFALGLVVAGLVMRWRGLR